MFNVFYLSSYFLTGLDPDRISLATVTALHLPGRKISVNFNSLFVEFSSSFMLEVFHVVIFLHEGVIFGISIGLKEILV